MGTIARRSITPDATDDVVALWSRKTADFAVLSGALDKRLEQLAKLKAELEPMLAIASTLDEADAIVAKAKEVSEADGEALGKRAAALSDRETNLTAKEAAYTARNEGLAAEEAARAAMRADLEAEKQNLDALVARRTADLAEAEAALDEGRIALADDRAALAADRKEVNRLLAKLQQPE